MERIKKYYKENSKLCNCAIGGLIVELSTLLDVMVNKVQLTRTDLIIDTVLCVGAGIVALIAIAKLYNKKI